MALSLSRVLFAKLVALALAAPATAAPPPGMRWGDHSGLHPSTGRSRPSTGSMSVSPRMAYPSAPRMVYPSAPRAVYPTLGPGVTYYYYPTAPRVVYPAVGPVVTNPGTVVWPTR